MRDVAPSIVDPHGYALLAAQSNFDTAGVFAILIVLMAIGMMLNAVMRLIEARVTFWARDLTTVGL